VPAQPDALRRVRILLGIAPFIATLIPLPWVNRVEPRVFGFPFLMFWLCACVVLTTACMALIYRLDPANRDLEPSGRTDGR
jgi:hypothetical protein